jgi:hypothetical protein
MDVLRNIRTINAPVDYTVTETEAWSEVVCPGCSNPRMLIVARRDHDSYLDLGITLNTWLLCISCGTGAVADSYGVVWPGQMAYPTPDGTPEAETKIWEEIRKCLCVDAYNAVAMLCRKLLLHLVFTHERSQNPHATPRRMTFAEAVQYLLDNGVITAAHKPLATEIKDIGNRANHELPDITEDEARKIALFTNYLFVSVYEMPKKASISTAFVGPAAQPYEGDLDPDASNETDNAAHNGG